MNSTSPFPELIIDLNIVRANIQKMTEKAARNTVAFRPHFKTHQSHAIGRMFREAGTQAITVSSLKMAHYFAEDGWDDITIAFPINTLAAAEYNALAAKIHLKTLATSKETVKLLDAQLSHPVGLYIEIDTAYGRSGVPVTDLNMISELIDEIERSGNCHFSGFYCHAGHSYKARGKDEIEKIAHDSLQKLQTLNTEFKSAEICYGDTPTCSVLDDFGPATQLSPGNFVYYDWMQVEIGSCNPADIALYMECPVIEKFGNRHEILIHGGAVHFSKENLLANDTPTFGRLLTDDLSPQNHLSKISQEHGIIHCSPMVYNNVFIGDKVQIYPVHSCLTANLMRGAKTTDGQIIDHMNGQSLNPLSL